MIESEIFLQRIYSEESARERSEDMDKLVPKVNSIVNEPMAMKGQRNEQLPQNPNSAEQVEIKYEDITEGVGDEAEKIVEQLCGKPKALQFISIVGMTGIGKTTLAKYVYNDKRTREKFPIRVWVTASQNYDRMRVFHSILDDLDLDKKADKLCPDFNEAQADIHQYLTRRKYLFVIDDVWSTRVLDDMRLILHDDEQGSRVVLTTRLMNVAKYNTNFLQKKEFLNKIESWELLERRVFSEEQCPPQLKGVGKSIASKCEGLPQAIVQIAEAIKNDRTKQRWEEIEEKVESTLDDGKLSNMLSESFNHLSDPLKKCFLYMGGFPKDNDISVSALTKLWIAEGFLTSNDGSTLEQEANKCLNELVERSLVRITKKRANGDFKNCTMHDLLRSFCRRRASDKGFFHVEHEKGFCLLDNGKLVRSILSFGNGSYSIFETPPELDNIKLLKVLRVCDTASQPILEAILQMSFLKYLELHLDYQLERLSKSIVGLQNLQTLIVHCYPPHSISLPYEIWKMIRLRHLIIDAMTLIPITTLTEILVEKLELQTLLKVENFIFTNKTIEIIPNLTKLEISCTTAEGNGVWESYCLDNLVKPACQLTELKIIVIAALVPNVDPICSSFVLPFSLTKLSLKGCKFSWLEMAVVDQLPNLLVLRLREDSFVGGEWELREEGFPKLKFLLMEGLNLSQWKCEVDFPFHCLEHLEIRCCRELDSIPLEIGDIQTLKLIDVYKSPGARTSAMRILEVQQDEYANEDLRVRVDN